MKPVIGITSGLADEQFGGVNYRRHSVSYFYAQAVHAAGGVPIVISPIPGAETEMLDVVDGVILSGGADVDPAHYGEAAVHPQTYGVDPTRDHFELALIKEAFARDLPILGICRGIQTLNVSLGGTLHQHVPDLTETPHRQGEVGIDCYQPAHGVSLKEGTPLARLFGTLAVDANTFHHQAIKDVAPALAVAGTADDGTIEAVYAPGRRSVVGLQWHPEMMFQVHSQQLAPFVNLVEAARERKLATTR